jgi:hypothetical protein
MTLFLRPFLSSPVYQDETKTHKEN